ncbi:MAG: DUF2786 domain-containing protein [Acidimicrobiales bacterium]
MGKNNRARRAAKARTKASRHHVSGHHGPTNHGPGGGGGSGGSGPHRSVQDLARELVQAAVFTPLRGSDGPIVAPALLTQLAQLPATAVDPELTGQLRRLITLPWSNGWQPLEVVRQVRRATSAVGARLATATVLADHATRHPDTLHQAWAEQIDQLRHGATPVVKGTADPHADWFGDWSRGEALGRVEVIRYALRVCHVLVQLHRIEELLPPPGQAQTAARRTQTFGAQADSPILAKVRALLAQAESTTFPAEAEAFTAKAQELMTRYAIDHAVLHGSTPGEKPTARRVPIEEPYLDAKSFLLHVVSTHNRTKSVYTERYAFVTVVGFEADLAATDMLFTSLLVQAQTALTAEGRNAPAGSRTRSRSFRSSFLLAYAQRIGHRLEEINQSVLQDTAPDAQRSALPVLAARRHEVDEAVDALFPSMRTASTSIAGGWDGMGALRGQMAADAARLSFADLPGSS